MCHGEVRECKCQPEKIQGRKPDFPAPLELDIPLPASTDPPSIGDLLAAEAVCIAAGKKLCGMCGWKATGEWRCTKYPASQRLKSPASFGTCPVFLEKPSAPRPPQPKKKGLPVPPGIKFLYFVRPQGGDSEHYGVVTVAWIESSPGILHMAFSFCSPGDKWCKVTGRDIALERLLRPIVVPYLYSPERTAYEVARAVMSHDFGRVAALTPGATMWGSVPSWTKDLAKRLMGGTERRGRGFGQRSLSQIILAIHPEIVSRVGAPRRRFLGAPPIDYSLSIMARMMNDIAKLGRSVE